MLCNEFVDELNQRLDERNSNGDELLEEHARSCRACRLAWNSFRRCERVLAQTDLVADERLTDRVLHQAKRRSEEQRRRKRAVVMSFAVTIAAGLLALATAISTNPTRQPDAAQEREAASIQVTAVAPVDPWSQWYAGQNLPSVNELWNLPWPTDRTDASVSESVSSGLRPVAESMNSAFKVIRQNVLPTIPQPGSSDEQAGHYARFAAIA